MFFHHSKLWITVFLVCSGQWCWSAELADHESVRGQWSRTAIVLDKTQVKTQGDEVTIIRTGQTPDKVTVEMTVPTRVKAKRSRRSGESVFISDDNCFNFTYDRRQMSRRNINCNYERDCLKEDDNGKCISERVTRRCQGRQSSHGQRAVIDDGIQRGLLNAGVEVDNVRIDFSRLPRLERGETEVYVLKGFQRRPGRKRIKYQLESIQTKECVNPRYTRSVLRGQERIRLRPSSETCRSTEAFWSDDAIGFQMDKNL